MVKLLDRKRGTILGINALDLLILLILLLLSLFFVSKFLLPERESRRFSGLNLRSAVVEYWRLAGEGLVVFADIEGSWTANGTDFKGRILATGALETTLFGWVDGRELSIGGTNAYVEEIAAKSITFVIGSPSVIQIPLKGVVNVGDLRELVEYFREIADTISGDFGVQTLKVETYSLVFDIPGFEPDAQTYAKLSSEFSRRIPYKILYLYLSKNFISLRMYAAPNSIRDVDLMEIGDIFQELEINCTQLFTSNVKLYVGTKGSLAGAGTYRKVIANALELSEAVDTTKITYVPNP